MTPIDSRSIKFIAEPNRPIGAICQAFLCIIEAQIHFSKEKTIYLLSKASIKDAADSESAALDLKRLSASNGS